MNGAFGIIYNKKDKKDQSFLCGYLKILNLIRVGNCDIDTDVASTVESFVISLKKIIGTDAEFASKALQRFGARQEVHQVVRPTGVDLEYKKPLGDKYGFTQSTTDMTVKPFLNIHAALSPPPEDIESTDLMKGLLTVALMALSSAPFSTFTEALRLATKNGITIGQKDIPKIYHCVQTRTKKPYWSNGSPMSPEDVKIYLATPFPV